MTRTIASQARSLRLGQKFKPCPYCGRKFYATDRSRAENPFCSKCLHERMREAVRERDRLLDQLRPPAESVPQPCEIYV